ncbi:hypothetical protein E1A91_D09G009100v1 [Gossypium mustelinum]|uniref:Mitochondrial import inner membrane translocase subunit TIM50 n=1 Tax=Gossypium mustelinum TaxID=34275 RepID=A0A5D2TE06_GOSMU|nr:hypothetical protein E1A91_D09G009100v1 [Gossypium mustelinum]
MSRKLHLWELSRQARMQPRFFQKQGPTLSDEGNSEEKIDSFDANETSDVSLAIVIPPVSQSRKKLLVLDLNGLLADIVYNPSIDCTPDALVAGRAVFKRPYCDDFLKFCCERFEVGIWSSRNRKNVERFIDFLMGDMKQKLLFCWDSSYCTTTQFNTLGHKYKPLVFKDLRKLWEKHDPDLPWEKGYYNESNTLLIDDSPYKALLNPVPDIYIYIFFDFLLIFAATYCNISSFIQVRHEG